jgi:hypothetical protein
MTHSIIQSTIKAVAALVVGFGVIVAAAVHPASAGVAAFFADLLFWPLDDAPNLESPAARLLAGIGGGVMVGWGVALWLLATRLLPSNPPLATTIVRTSVVSWFVVDSIASIVAGAPLNAALNLAFAAAFLWPLSRLSRLAQTSAAARQECS